MPVHLAAYGDTWERLHPTWAHRLWTEDNLPELVNADVFDRAETIAPGHEGQLRADVARYEILYRFGGVYVDADLEALRPIDELLDGRSCFVGWEDPGVWINNACMAAEPGHPFFAALIAGLPAHVDRLGRRGITRPNRLTGPQYATPIYREHAATVTAFPKEHFYPYLWNELERIGEHFPESYAVHHWHHRRTTRKSA